MAVGLGDVCFAIELADNSGNRLSQTATEHRTVERRAVTYYLQVDYSHLSRLLAHWLPCILEALHGVLCGLDMSNVVCVHGVKTDERYSVDGQYPCRPPAFEGRLTPKHWEGCLSKGVHDRCAAKSFGHVQVDRAINGSRWFAVPVLAQEGCDLSCFSQEEQDVVA